MSMCIGVCNFPCWESWSPRPHGHTSNGRTTPQLSKKRSTKMTATLHFLWGLSPKCLCTSTKPSSLPQNLSCISQQIRNFYSCLSSLLPASSSVLGVSVSWQHQLSCLSQTPTTTCAISHPELLLLLHHSHPAVRKVNFCQSHSSPAPAQEEGAFTRPWGASTLPSPCLYPQSAPNPN